MEIAFILMSFAFAIQSVRLWRYKRLFKQAVIINGILRNANDGLMRVAYKEKVEWPEVIND